MRLPAILLAGLFVLCAAAPASAQKLGYINSRTILDEAPGAKEAREQFDKEMAQYRTEASQMGEELRRMMQQFEQQQLTLSPQAKEERRNAINQKQDEYQRRLEQLDTQAQRRQDEIFQPIMAKVNQVIDQIRREGSYGIIFDVGAGAIIAADPALDLTSEVIRRLRAMAQASSNPPSP